MTDGYRRWKILSFVLTVCSVAIAWWGTVQMVGVSNLVTINVVACLSGALWTYVFFPDDGHHTSASSIASCGEAVIGMALGGLMMMVMWAVFSWTTAVSALIGLSAPGLAFVATVFLSRTRQQE